jgi:hypothetical protein
VSFLSNPQRVQVSLEGAPIDYLGRSKHIACDVFHSVLSIPELGHPFALALRFLAKVVCPASDTSARFWTGNTSAS